MAGGQRILPGLLPMQGQINTTVILMVRKERLELSRLAALEPKSSASTNSATFALSCSQLREGIIALTRTRPQRTHLP